MGDKPVSAFNSTTSLGPLQSTQNMGPGQKFSQQMGLPQFKKSKSIVGSSDNLHSSMMSSKQMSQTCRGGPTVAQLAPKTTTNA